jgi:hypothetical protein
VKVNGEKSALKNLIGHQLNRNVGLFLFTKMHCFFGDVTPYKPVVYFHKPNLQRKKQYPNSAILPLPKGKKVN